MSERFLCINKDEQGVFSISLVDMCAGNGVDVNYVNHITAWSGGAETIFVKWILDANQLRTIARIFMEAAVGCEFDNRVPPESTLRELLDEINAKNRQLEILQEQVEALTDEINKLRVKYQRVLTKEFVAGEKS